MGKQRVECKQLLEVLLKGKTGWSNHPAAKMWRGFEYALCEYTLEICAEWQRRGYQDTIEDYILDVMPREQATQIPMYPLWLGDEAFHDSHKSNLLRKDVFHYGQFGWTVPNNLPYVWP